MAHLTTDSSLTNVVESIFDEEISPTILLELRNNFYHHFIGGTTQDPLIVFQKDGKLPFKDFLTESGLTKSQSSTILRALKNLGFVIN